MLKIKGYFGSLVTYDFLKYDSYEIQFHVKSEHTIKGLQHDLEVQLLYRCITPGYISKLAVLSVLFKIKAGIKNKFFDGDIDILDLPDQTFKKRKLKNKIDFKNLFLQDNEDTYQPFSYYQYEGSLSSPPCQEDTNWFIASEVLPISYTTVEYLKDALKPSDFQGDKTCLKINLSLGDELPENYRNVKNLNGRPIYYYENTCGDRSKHKHAIKGHYEKVEKSNTKYFFVRGNKPSGIPGAFTVSKSEAKNLMNSNNPSYNKYLSMFNPKFNTEFS